MEKDVFDSRPSKTDLELGMYVCMYVCTYSISSIIAERIGSVHLHHQPHHPRPPNRIRYVDLLTRLQTRYSFVSADSRFGTLACSHHQDPRQG